MDVFRKHLNDVSYFYCKRRDVMAAAADKHLKGKCKWRAPSGGMFFWIEVLGTADTSELIKERARGAKVLMLPGVSFSPIGAASPFVRASFSTATDVEIDTAMFRFASLLQ